MDRKTGKEGVTLAGLLMFGKEDSIKEQDALSNYFPDYRERLSKDENIRWTDRIYPDGTWECNLLQFYLKVWPKLSSTLPKPFRLDNDERIDETPTHIALREAFVNALVHTDYSLSGNIIIELDTEKFVLSNPGTLLVSLQQYYEGGISECRNPSLQQMFMLIGRAEKAGSGVDKIMSGWQHSHWRRPFLQIESQPDRVILTLPMFSVIPDTILNELNTIFKDVRHLAPDELTVLSFCLIEGSISNRRLQYVLNMHSVDITDLLKKMCKNSYLESDNNGRWTIYKLNLKVDTSGTKVDTSGTKVDTSGTKVDTSGTKVDTSSTKVDTSGTKVDTSGTKVDTSGTKVDTSNRKVDTSSNTKINTSFDRKVDSSFDRKVDTSFDRKVDTSFGRKVDTSSTKVDTSNRKVDTSSNTKINTAFGRKVDTSFGRKVDTSAINEKAVIRLSKEELEQLIMRVCKNNYVKLEKIATIVCKSVDYLKNKIVPAMIKDGKLEKRYPYTHNHPEQGYKTGKDYLKEL
jgi:hypothetical protein